MGYTHYWKFNPTVDNETTEKQFEKALQECAKIMESKPSDIAIFGYDDDKEGFYGEPEFTPTLICFNGDESQNLDHESFYFTPFERTEFNFCKTARKPYDLVVCAVLISLANNLEGFSFSSDGGMGDDEWLPAFELYESIGGILTPVKKSFMTAKL